MMKKKFRKVPIGKPQGNIAPWRLLTHPKPRCHKPNISTVALIEL
jgi:hypothetical protein